MAKLYRHVSFEVHEVRTGSTNFDQVEPRTWTSVAVLNLNLWVRFGFGPGSPGPGPDRGQTRNWVPLVVENPGELYRYEEGT